MNELTTINNGKVVVSSRQVSESFEKQHDKVVRDIDNIIEGGIPKIGDTPLFIESTYRHPQNKQLYREYLMTRDGFTLLAMGFTGQKAFNWKLKYIEAFNKMEKMLNNSSPSYAIEDPIERAKAWIKEQEEKRLLAKEIHDLQPKVVFADSVTTSKTSILVGELSKILKQNGVEIGQNRLFEWLRANGYLIKRKGTDYNMPTQYSMERGWFEIKETTINHADGHISINKTPKITGIGQLYFINKFLNKSLSNNKGEVQWIGNRSRE